MIFEILLTNRVIQKVNWSFLEFLFSLFESHLASLTHNKCIGTPQWAILGMVKALVCRLEGGGDNGDSRDVQWSLIGYLILQSKFSFRLILVH